MRKILCFLISHIWVYYVGYNRHHFRECARCGKIEEVEGGNRDKGND